MTASFSRSAIPLFGHEPTKGTVRFLLIRLAFDQFDLPALGADLDLCVPPTVELAEVGLERHSMTSVRPGKGFRKIMPRGCCNFLLQIQEFRRRKFNRADRI
jgi:hypothetical protein